MNNPFQEQLLKAGVVSQQQVNRVNQEKKKKQRKQRGKKRPETDERQLKAQQAAKHKADRDRELNQRKEEQARNRAISIEIDQLIKTHKLKRDDSCDLAYNFEHQGKVKRLYINADMRARLLKGQLGIARIEGNYELVPKDVAEKIRARNDKRVLLFDEKPDRPAEDDPYADYQIPDDLTW